MSRTGLIVAGVAGYALMIALFVVIIIELDLSRNRIESQERIAGQQARTTGPVIEDVRAALRVISPLLDDAKEESEPIMEGLRGLEPLINGLPATSAAVRGAARRAFPALDALAGVNFGSAIPEIAALAQELSASRLDDAADATVAFLTEVRDRGLAARAEESARRLRRLLGVQRRAHAVLSESLEVQRRTLDHVRSIDRRLGGLVPVAP